MFWQLYFGDLCRGCYRSRNSICVDACCFGYYIHHSLIHVNCVKKFQFLGLVSGLHFFISDSCFKAIFFLEFFIYLCPFVNFLVIINSFLSFIIGTDLRFVCNRWMRYDSDSAEGPTYFKLIIIHASWVYINWNVLFTCRLVDLPNILSLFPKVY